jgi:hypothetical protein
MNLEYVLGFTLKLLPRGFLKAGKARYAGASFCSKIVGFIFRNVAHG